MPCCRPACSKCSALYWRIVRVPRDRLWLFPAWRPHKSLARRGCAERLPRCLEVQPPGGSASRRICCATASPPTCWKAAWTHASFKPCWAIAVHRYHCPLYRRLAGRHRRKPPVRQSARPVAETLAAPGRPRRARQTLMPRPALELADIFRQHGPAYRQSHFACPCISIV